MTVRADDRSGASLNLDDRDLAALHGELGSGPALAMRVLVPVARSMGARRLIDVRSAHVDGCFYIGDVSLDFARRLAATEARVSVPTTTNVGSVDRLHPGDWRGGREFAVRARRLMDIYSSLGCKRTWTCAPYQTWHRPQLGEHVAWGESNAVVFANSVLGARTERYGDFVDISAAIVGRAPLVGLHTDEKRRGQLLVRVGHLPKRWTDAEVFFPLLGHLVGRLAGSQVPVIEGIDAASEDELKALGAAAASTGSVALFHVVGVTPEAETTQRAFHSASPKRTVEISVDDLRAAWAELGSKVSGRLAAVCVGTPHFSEAEFADLARLLDGRSLHRATPLVVSTSRHVWSKVEASGIGSELRNLGVQVVTDTCTYNTPLLGRLDGSVLTNSAKFAWYAPANIGAQTVFAGLSTCVESAVAGELVADPLG